MTLIFITLNLYVLGQKCFIYLELSNNDTRLTKIVDLTKKIVAENQTSDFLIYIGNDYLPFVFNDTTDLSEKLSKIYVINPSTPSYFKEVGLINNKFSEFGFLTDVAKGNDSDRFLQTTKLFFVLNPDDIIFQSDHLVDVLLLTNRINIKTQQKCEIKICIPADKNKDEYSAYFKRKKYEIIKY